ncbi:hypothetical protein MWMV18_MWMV18_02547 [Acinetobacter calcoaceticus]|nr:hypothetical protein MWMV18_MWMV18_02547 [Acinetobacter calcoaceticus]
MHELFKYLSLSLARYLSLQQQIYAGQKYKLRSWLIKESLNVLQVKHRKMNARVSVNQTDEHDTTYQWGYFRA